MKKINLALLSGGISSERDVSIASGNQVYNALDQNKYNITRYDPKTDLDKLVSDAPGIDAALVILHGPFGEDGTVQGLLDLLNIPYQGSGVLGSAIAMNKLVSKQLYEKAGLNIPSYLIFNKKDRPNTGGSSIGMSIIKSSDLFSDALNEAFAYDDTVLIEAFIKGIELTGGVLGNTDLQALPLIEIIPEKGHEYFDYVAKYTAGITREICPARIDQTMTEKAMLYAKTAHRALFCKGYSRTDMILKNNQLYVLETNTIPGMTPTSLFPQAAAKAGIDFTNLLDRLIQLSME